MPRNRDEEAPQVNDVFLDSALEVALKEDLEAYWNAAYEKMLLEYQREWNRAAK